MMELNVDRRMLCSIANCALFVIFPLLCIATISYFSCKVKGLSLRFFLDIINNTKRLKHSTVQKIAKLRYKKLYLLAVARMPLKNICFTIQYNLLYALILLALCSFCLLINLFSAVTLFFAHSLVTKSVVLKLVGSIEPNRCHASIHRTLNHNQEWIQKILEGVCSFELG